MPQGRALTSGDVPGAGVLTLFPRTHCWPPGTPSFRKLQSSEAVVAEDSKSCPYLMHDRSVIVFQTQWLKTKHEAHILERWGGVTALFVSGERYETSKSLSILRLCIVNSFLECCVFLFLR